MAVKTYITLLAGVTRRWRTYSNCGVQSTARTLSVLAQNQCQLSCHVHSNQIGVLRGGQVGHIADTGDHSCSRLDDAP